MRLFTVALALWFDPLWLRNARRSWRVRRFWFSVVSRQSTVVSPQSSVRSRPFDRSTSSRLRAWFSAGRWSLHLLAFDVHVRLEGVKRGQ
jgi:hypothetical protein